MDYYSILGVSKTATQDEIKRAYRKLAGQHHPDKGGSKERFQEIQEAYDTLGDAPRRQHYDAYGRQPPGGPPNSGGFHFEFGNNPFDDIFAAFGVGRQQRTTRQMFSTVIFITLEQVASGGTKSVQLNFPNGPRHFDIQIPQGIEDGQQIRYDSLLPDASVLVQFRIVPHDTYTRRGLDLHTSVHLNVFDMILGTKHRITDILGSSLEIEIPPRTKSNTMLRLNGRGLQIQNQRGDLYVLIHADIPATISTELLQEIENERKRKTI